MRYLVHIARLVDVRLVDCLVHLDDSWKVDKLSKMVVRQLCREAIDTTLRIRK